MGEVRRTSALSLLLNPTYALFHQGALICNVVCQVLCVIGLRTLY